MKIKKAVLSLVVVMLVSIFLIAMIPANVLAATATTPLYLGVTELRTNNTPNLGYAIGNPNDNQTTGTAAKIWNIVKYSDSTSSTFTEADIYCVKAGVGFSDTNKRETYNTYYNMKTQEGINEILDQTNTELPSIVQGYIPVVTTAVDEGDYSSSAAKLVSKYRALLALADMLYLVNDTNSTEAQKTALLEEAGIYEEYWDTILTEDEIEAVQQAAIWYFTNYGEENGKYDKTDDTAWLNYTEDGKNYKSFSAYNPTNVDIGNSYGTQRQQQAEMLYNYLIEEALAKAEAGAYSYLQVDDNPASGANTNAGAPAEVTTTNSSLKCEESGNNYIIGPIRIDKTQGNNTPYTIDFEVTNGGTTTNYTLLNSDKTAVSSGTTVKDLVGKDFYISVPKDTTTTIGINISINYSATTLNLWTNSNNNQAQPVMIPERKPQKDETKLTITPEEPETGVFDLALRKYITKVGNTTLEGASSRVPNIDTGTLDGSGTTATYKHKKDPVVVETGDVVTYNLTIYNEGDKAGRATRIVDQLPEGLVFNRVVSGNFELAENGYNETTNTVTLERIDGNTEDLEAYTGGTLDSETIQIECTVEATPSTASNTILTNVAWIAEEYNSEDDVTITNQDGEDRDSEPATTPDVNKDNMSDYTGNGNKTDLTDSDYYYKGQQDDDDFEKLVLLPQSFDLKLIKRIVAVNNQNVPERIESVDVSDLNTIGADGNLVTTAEYNLNKDPVSVKKGDIVTYTFRIYNEGTIDGYAQEITEDIPEGLEFIWSEKEGEELEADTTLTAEEKEAVEFNQSYLWTFEPENIDANGKVTEISTDYLSKENETTGSNLIEAFGPNDGTKTEADLHYKEVSVKLKVVSENLGGTVIRNEACVSEDADSEGNPVDDRDSDTEEWVKYEDDEDYDNIILQNFDLALRKFIIAVSDDETIENSEYLRDSSGAYTRAPVVDTSLLNTTDANGNLITTAIYNHTKEPVSVRVNDYVIYMLRVYNEGDIDGYAAEIKDHLPPYLEYVEGEFNSQYGWEVSEDGRTVTTRYLEDHIVNKAELTDNGYVLSYVEVPIMCKVTDNAPTGQNITNIADITEYQDENKEPADDRDSEEDNVELPSDENLPGYKDDETGEYIPGQEDDDDFEKVIIEEFDLALRKFITKVNENDVTNRIPEVSYDATTGQITYNHTKDPVQVVNGNIVTYTIRVYNEGQINGYASEITDDIPEGLEFLPDNETNINYRWVMYDSEGNVTENVEEAETIRTDYLSKEQEENPGDNLLEAFNPNEPISETNPSYKDVQVAFRVIEPNESDRVLVNSAQISEDTDEDGNEVDDKDSTPGEWNEGEDDQDREYVELLYFDLSLRKWVTQAIVIDNKTGQTTITDTGHGPYDDPEDVVKVELYRKNINDVTVKFRYSIRVTNEGEIAGYAKEVTDYVPEGLTFLPEDNPGWTDEGNNVISTRLLENTLLQPGEYAEVEVVLTWINGEDNMGVMNNIAEISEDYNDYDVPDKDSTPDNQVDGEDDIDEAPVMLSISTGRAQLYIGLGLTILVTIAGGVALIKRFVL